MIKDDLAAVTSEAPNPPSQNRRWKQFGMRSLLILLVLSALGAVWINRAYRQRVGIKAIQDYGGRVWYSDQVDERGNLLPSAVSRSGNAADRAPNHFFDKIVRIDFKPNDRQPWRMEESLPAFALQHDRAWQVISLLSDLRFLSCTKSDIEDLERLRGHRKLVILEIRFTEVDDLGPLLGMKELKELRLQGAKVSDLSPLANLKKLELLDIEDTPVSDIGPLSNLSELNYLNLQGTRVSDIAPLKQLHKLKTLFLNNTEVTELSPLAGSPSIEFLMIDQTSVSDLKPLFGLPKIDWLNMNKTKVSEDHVQEFSKATPNCYVVH